MIFEGKVEKFPAYEMYVVVNGGVPHVLFQLSPEEGATVLNLIGAPGREVFHSVEIPL